MQELYKCQEKRPGSSCIWALKDGRCKVLWYCSEIVKECKGCGKIVFYKEKAYCAVTLWPEYKWDLGKTCNMATHVKRAAKVTDEKMLNPLKASKRSLKQSS